MMGISIRVTVLQEAMNIGREIFMMVLYPAFLKSIPFWKTKNAPNALRNTPMEDAVPTFAPVICRLTAKGRAGYL